MLDRIMAAEPPVAAAAAHTLKGSARGIGAWRVARAAEGLERAAGCNAAARNPSKDADTLDGAIAELKTASLEAGAAIAARLTALLGGHAGSR
jgi:HPt (histidine-containing phosphotransfer) domain-containing protein